MAESQAAAPGVHARDGAQGLSREGHERRARPAAAHLCAHGRRDPQSGGPWLLGKRHRRSPTSSVMPAIVRMADLGLDTMWKDLPRVGRWYDADPRAAGVQADLLSRLVADRAVPTFEGEGDGADVGRVELARPDISVTRAPPPEQNARQQRGRDQQRVPERELRRWRRRSRRSSPAARPPARACARDRRGFSRPDLMPRIVPNSLIVL